MTNTLIYPSISGVEFIDNSVMFVHLSNDRTFIVPLDKFPSIQALSKEAKKNIEIIDEKYLSFLEMDEIFSIEELIGIQA